MIGIQTNQAKNFVTIKSIGEPQQIEYIDKLRLGAINERGMYYFTESSYVMDASLPCKTASYFTGRTGFGLTSLAPAATAAGELAAAAVRKSCDDGFNLGGPLHPIGAYLISTRLKMTATQTREPMPFQGRA